MSYNGFYTRQEQDDVLATRIDNPNRVGSGFINFGAMERTNQPAANWQTASLVGGGPNPVAPAMVSDIWAAAPAPQAAPVHQQPRLPPQPTPQMVVQPQLSVQPFAAPPGQQRDVASIFQSLQLDAVPPSQQITSQQPFMGAGGASASACAYGVLGMSAAAAQQAYGMNGGLQQPQPPPPSAPQQQQTQTLMNLLQAQAPGSAPSLAPVYGGLGNGTMSQAGSCATRMQAAFSNTAPPAPQCQLQNGCSHASAFASGAFAPSASRQQVPRVAQPAVPKSLSSAADYAVAAQVYKAPPATRVTAATVPSASVARKPEASSKAQSGPVAAKEEWDCPRCTFSNNSLVFECEMCGFERPGKAADIQPTPRSAGHEDDGWKPAAVSSSARKSAPVPNSAAAASGKSKAQSKNEKRRSKKRGD